MPKMILIVIDLRLVDWLMFIGDIMTLSIECLQAIDQYTYTCWLSTFSKPKRAKKLS